VVVTGSRPSPRRGDSRDYARCITISQDERFILLRRKIGQIILLVSALFIGWYFLYVLASVFAPGVMRHRLVGNVNVAFVFGVLQFGFTFLLARRYTRYAREALDPLTAQIVADAGRRATRGEHSENGDGR
jgi:uncharacterized membrane protein (DUF485 family)